MNKRNFQINLYKTYVIYTNNEINIENITSRLTNTIQIQYKYKYKYIKVSKYLIKIFFKELIT